MTTAQIKLPMESLAELKRTLKAGMRIKLIETNTQGKGEMAHHKYLNIVRTITKVQTNSFAMATDEQLAEGKKGSWIDFPPAKNVAFKCDGIFKFIFEYPQRPDALPYEISQRDVFEYQIMED